MTLLNAVGSSDPEQLLNETQVADLICQSVRTLQKWRMTGAGPAFCKLASPCGIAAPMFSNGSRLVASPIPQPTLSIFAAAAS